jgi:hypothetical protein
LRSAAIQNVQTPVSYSKLLSGCNGELDLIGNTT